MSNQDTANRFTFEISLSILNHLGRNLYRSFATVLGEAISNAWDADASNVHIEIAPNRKSFLIKDDGIGMSAYDFQNKFLRIGYSKRKESKVSPKGRPYIGRKGIGKLALLSCAEKISVVSKQLGADYVGGTIDNAGLDDAITRDLAVGEYPLGHCSLGAFDEHTKGHRQGTIIRFQNIHDGIRNSLKFLKTTVALYFRFSLIDPDFRMFINGEEITHECLKDLASKTEFLWKVNTLEDPYMKALSQVAR